MAKIKCKYDEIIDLHKLVGHKNNANKHPDNQVKLLAKNIDFQGWRLPIIVSNRSGMVVAGHGRMLAAEKLKEEKVPVVYQDFETEAQEYAFLISENKLSELAKHDDAMMIDTLRDMDFDLDFDLLGMDNFSLPEIKQLDDANEDTVPTDVETRCKKGDLWILGEHRLLCGDATNIQHVERLMSGEKADMVFTDPPYGINESGQRLSRGGEYPGQQYKDFKDDSVQYAVDAYNLCEGLNIPTQVWFGANYYSHTIPQSNNWLVWDKRLEDNQKDNNSDCELAFVKSNKSSIRIFRHLWKGMIKGSEHGQKRVHPTQKPIALAEWCFENYGKQKSVLDLFGGSGSTLIACEKTNRKCYMMELDEHYCSVILKRWEDYTGQKARLESNENNTEN